VSDLAAWFLTVGWFAAIVLLTAYAAKSFAGDAARGRRRCPRCWHELGPAPVAESAAEAEARTRHCAECGFTAPREKDTLRTRRHLVRGTLALAAILALVAAARVRFLAQGPWTVAPTRILLLASPHVGGGGFRSVQAELAARIRGGALDGAQTRDAVELVVTGDGAAPPGSEAWRTKYGGVADALLGALARDDLLRVRFLEIPPELVVAFLGARDGRPQLLDIDAVTHWPAGAESRLRVTFADGTERRARFNPSSRSNNLMLEVPPDVGPGDEIRFVLSVRAGGRTEDDGWIDYPTVLAEVPSQLGRSAKEPDAKPVDSPEMRAVIEQVFADSQALALWTAGTPRAGLRFNRAMAGDEFPHTLFGVRIEVLENGNVRRTSRIWWCGGPTAAEIRWLAPIEDIDALERLAAQDPSLDANWTMRISGDMNLADYARPPVGLRPDRSGFTYWSGSFEMPLGVQRMNAPSPERRWTIDP
jgi:hypothetical protein